MDKKRVGHWSAFFGGPKPFEYVIKRARDFGAKWGVLALPTHARENDGEDGAAMGTETERQIGRWSKLFRKWMSFEEEVSSAREIASKWKLGLDGKQLDVVIEPIAGYASPAWGSDRQWLYQE